MHAALPPVPDLRPWSARRRAWRYFVRASRLSCPHCGTKLMFIPLRETRGLRDWFTPLDGCPRCGYAYEREIGYFLLAIWAIGYGCGSLLGLAIYLILETYYDVSMTALLVATLLPVFVFAMAFARHAKAYFLAFDHFFDPPVPDVDDPPGDDGNLAVPKPAPGPPLPSPASRG